MPNRTIIPLLLTLVLVGCSDDGVQVIEDSGLAKLDGKADSWDKGPPPDITKPPPDITKPKPDTVPTKTADVCGIVQEPSGAVLTNYAVIMCSDLNGCRSDLSTAVGKFCLSIENKGEYIFHAMKAARGGKNYTEIYFPVTVTQADIDGEKEIYIGKVVVPFTAKALQTVDMKNGGAYDLGGGVSVTIGAGISKKPPMELDLKVGAAVLQKGEVRPRSGTHYKGSGKLHMAVVFSPLETVFTAPVSFKFPAKGLTAGAAVEVYFLSDKDGKLTKQADSLESGGSIANVTGQGLKNLGIFLVYTK